MTRVIKLYKPALRPTSTRLPLWCPQTRSRILVGTPHRDNNPAVAGFAAHFRWRLNGGYGSDFLASTNAASMPASNMASARDISETARAVCRVIVIGATNYPHLIDAVLLRSGSSRAPFRNRASGRETTRGYLPVLPSWTPFRRGGPDYSVGFRSRVWHGTTTRNATCDMPRQYYGPANSYDPTIYPRMRAAPRPRQSERVVVPIQVESGTTGHKAPEGRSTSAPRQRPDRPPR